MKIKICKNCNKEKSITEFSNKRKNCKECSSIIFQKKYGHRKLERQLRIEAYKAQKVSKEETLAVIKSRLRTRLYYHIIKKKCKIDSDIYDIIGCSKEYLLEYLGKKPINAHLDHIIPLHWAKTKEELLALNHYTNLQWLSKYDNLSKKDKCPKLDKIEYVLQNHPNKKLLKQIIQ